MIRICHVGTSARTRPEAAALPERCARLGFDTVAYAWPALAGEGADFDGERVSAAAAAEPLRALGLAVMADLRLDLVAAAADVVRENTAWFQAVRAHDALLDPRRAPEPVSCAQARFDDPACRDGLVDWWRQQLRRWREAGVAAFRCLWPQCIPAVVWRALIADLKQDEPAARFFAWTPGLSPAEVGALAGCGFDGVFASLPWWDFCAPWFYEEHARLRCVAPVLAPVDDPLAVIASDERYADELAVRRRMLAAGAFGEGLLVGPWAIDADGELESAVMHANARLASAPAANLRRLTPLTAGMAPIAAIRIQDFPPMEEPNAGDAIALVNAHDWRVAEVDVTALLATAAAFERLRPADDGDEESIGHGDAFALEPGEVRLYRGQAAPPMRATGRAVKAAAAAQAPRVAIENLRPQIDGGRFPIKRVVGDVVTVEADIFSDGHGQIGAALRWRAHDSPGWQHAPMRPLGNDRWRAEFPVLREGSYLYTVDAWRDEFATLYAGLEKKRAAGVIIDADVEEAAAMVSAAAEACRGAVAKALRALARQLTAAATREERLAILLSPAAAAVTAQPALRRFPTSHPAELQVIVERAAARFGSWYELFPRSQSGRGDRHGTFDDVIARLPAIQAMGFDVVYMPPIHPIGGRNRKGRNNRLAASPDDPGSPYAIGSEEGGHDAVHPQLGTLEDFRRLMTAAQAQGMEIALDFAIQCSPDHPWLREHRGWFAWRPDGSLHYAENPPKKYEDIVNVEFYADEAVPSLWQALLDVVLFWAGQGVHLFRVDNPHTKPLPFWEWLIAQVRRREPRVLFLSEAFTRPKPMNRLAKLGFSQSYTYFTWRNGKHELAEYLTELSSGDVAEYFRPHFFVNTPDINPLFLQQGGRAGHLIRAALATTLSGLWGMYSGFELCEATPLPGKEEYLDSEKYEIRAWDWQRPGHIIAEITRLNALRRAHPELQTHLGVQFLNCDNEQILCFAKRTRLADTLVLVAVSLDPAQPQSGTIEVPLWELGLADHDSVAVLDLWTDHAFAWHGKHQRVDFVPDRRPFALWRIGKAMPS